jgi:hypothetical protein
MVAAPTKQNPVKQTQSNPQPATSKPLPPTKPTPPSKLDSNPKEQPTQNNIDNTANNTATQSTNTGSGSKNGSPTNTGSGSGWSRSNSTKKDNEKNSAERSKGSKERNFFSPRDKKTVFSDVDGGDTFSLFRRMNEIREEKKEMNKQTETKKPEPEKEEPKENPTQEQEYSDGSEPLIREFSVKEDMNKEGMKKAKKFSVTAGKGQPKFQMEVCSLSKNQNNNCECDIPIFL